MSTIIATVSPPVLFSVQYKRFSNHQEESVIVKNNFKGLSAIAVLTMAGLQAQPPRGGGPRQMPDAPGREVVQRVCGATCHGPEIVMGRGVGQDQWLATMNSMVSRGAKISDTEFPVVLNYLVTNFPPRGAAPAGPRQGGGGLTAGADDNHVVDPMASGRGKLIYIAECVTCHGVKARGTDNGADVVRSLVVLKDRLASLMAKWSWLWLLSLMRMITTGINFQFEKHVTTKCIFG